MLGCTITRLSSLYLNYFKGIYVAKTSGIIPLKKNVIVGMTIRDDDKVEWTDALDDRALRRTQFFQSQATRFLL